ncbi:MAG TPA: universal stress protein [Brevefilum fermentans]|jgi:nucleotide-binding universal stress UspA family protein|nr:universal stress protein [Brevefilum fermentans]
MLPGNENKIEYVRALEDFRRARAKARLQRLWAAFTGESLDLLRFNDISQRIRSTGFSSRGLQEIPVNAIVGSVNRYQDFNRNFLPLLDADIERWANVKAAITKPGGVGLAPILVYKIGEAYFVLDGNHRVSIAKQMGMEELEAYVTEIKTRVPITPEDSPDDIILKAEYSKFLENTNIDSIIPDATFSLTSPGQYLILEEHIHVHRHYMGLEQQREIPWDEAIWHWYEHVYQPLIEIIRDQNLMKEFPERTETDLYIWILDHQAYLQEQLGWSVRPEKAALDLLRQQSGQMFRTIKRWFRKKNNEFMISSTRGEKIHEGHELNINRHHNKLFSDILVAFSGKSGSWIALEQAVRVGALEGADVRGLVIKKGFDWIGPEVSEQEIIRHFSESLEDKGVHGNLVFAQGNIAETILNRNKVNDLVVLKLDHPPSTNRFARLKSGMRRIVRKSTIPMLFVCNELSEMNRMLLAYDGSPKGKQALYIATYLASRYDKDLSVVVVDQDEAQGQQKLSDAVEYLGLDGVRQIFRKPTKPTNIVILQVAEDINADLIIMGGYGFSPVLEIIFGSTVDGVLRGTHVPVLVAQ